MGWAIVKRMVAKTDATTVINGLSAADATETDPGTTDTSDTMFAGQLSAAQSAANSLAAALAGPAGNLDIEIQGIEDHSASAALPNCSASSIAVRVTERY